MLFLIVNVVGFIANTRKWFYSCLVHIFHVIGKGKGKGKGKALSVQAWTGPESSRRLRLPYFKTIGT